MIASQLPIFKDAILAQQSGNLTDHGAIAAYFNSPDSGFIWRPNITIGEINTALVGSEFIALTAVKQNLFIVLVSAPFVDATSANIRGCFSAIFSGTTLANLTALAKKTPTKFESLFTTSNVCTAFGQIITVTDVAEALGS